VVSSTFQPGKTRERFATLILILRSSIRCGAVFVGNLVNSEDTARSRLIRNLSVIERLSHVAVLLLERPNKSLSFFVALVQDSYVLRPLPKLGFERVRGSI
jgi:hypothetical protein